MTRIRIGGHEIELKNRDKVLFPDAGITKGDVIEYYRDVAELMLPHLRARPLTLQRFPDGIGKDGFYQQERSDYFPGWLGGVRLERAGGKGDSVHHIVCNDEASLVYLANQGTIALHGWLAVAERPHHPDRIVFDLDPPGDDFDPVRDAARQVADLMREIGLTPYPMTTGSRGVHVVAPLDGGSGFDAVRALARDMAERLAEAHPRALTTAQRKDQRRGRLYLDVMRNAYGQTAVQPYSLRARPGAPVATPLAWEELGRRELGPRSYDLGNLRRRLAQKEDPWADMGRHRVSAARARERLDAR
ncbi:MAG: non-homologous end-joining DNA ligase [Halofilum sp. (in: g-proteobacteria)]|nr:non-homologous end-joining DNA ligase [Halofilum sp. (in: g-proteobacteria)]